MTRPPSPPTGGAIFGAVFTESVAFDDLWLANGGTVSLDMSERFNRDDLSFDVIVTTTHKRMGVTRFGAINTVARNKVRGEWSDDVLTLTAGDRGRHVLRLRVVATGPDGSASEGNFRLTVGGEPPAAKGVVGTSLETPVTPATLVASFVDLVVC